MSDCRFGVSPVNYPDPDPDPDLRMSKKRYKELYIFEKGVFWSGPGRKSRGFRRGKGRKMGDFRAAHTRTVLI